MNDLNQRLKRLEEVLWPTVRQKLVTLIDEQGRSVTVNPCQPWASVMRPTMRPTGPTVPTEKVEADKRGVR